MKTAKETVYEFIQQEIYTSEDNKQGVETKTVAEALAMQRTNVSAVLNDLVKDGKLVKTNTRPVLFQIPKQQSQLSEKSCFTNLVGHNGSLRNAIQLAQAAILYPRSSLNVLLSSKMGCGTSYFASLMHRFAIEKGIFQKDAPFIKINCRYYEKNVCLISDDLFGVEENLQSSAFTKAKGGMLFIDNFDLLDVKQQSRVLSFLETNRLVAENKEDYQDFYDVYLLLSCSPQNVSQYNRRVPVTIELPELKDRPLEEKFELINYFFSIEGTNSNRSIEVTREAIQAILLNEYTHNVKELVFHIKGACAQAYIRVVDDLKQDISVCLSDFGTGMKRNLLKIKDNAVELDAILGMNESLFYDKATGYQELSTKNTMDDMYVQINKQYDELSNRGINLASIKEVIDTHSKNLFKKFSYYNTLGNHNNLEQLSKIVDSKIIHLVDKWIKIVKKDLGREFKTNVFYGICLHINSLLTMNYTHQRVGNDQIVKIIQEYPKEYAASVQLADVLKDMLDLHLPIEEIVLITMFLIEIDEQEEAHPVLLYIMHGVGTASSLRDVTNSLTHCHNAYSYDLSLEKNSKQAMDELRVIITEIDQGCGVLVIYDMGSIKTMIDTIAEEINVKIRYMNIPVTLIGIDVARKCSMEQDVDYVYHMANLELNNMRHIEEKRNEIIITLCHTGEGGAIQLKRFIDQYSKMNMKTVALAISSRSDLLKEVLALQKTYQIHAFVGTYDPRLLGIPFISIAKVFENDKGNLDRILMFEPLKSSSLDYSEIYKYLEEQLKYVSISKLKSVLPDVIDEFGCIYRLNEDQRIGLFMHIACTIERLLDGECTIRNDEKNKIISVFEEDYKVISKILVVLEKTFKVIMDDNEIATIIMIIKKI